MPPTTRRSREEDDADPSTLESGEEDLHEADTMPPPPRRGASSATVAGRPPADSTPPTGARTRMRADVDALLDRASSLILQGRFERAARAALACIQAEPHDPRGYLWCAIAHESLGRFALAERLLREALALDPYSAEARLRLEMLLERRGPLI